MSCTCPSYKYTFAEHNWKHKAHLGVMPEKYSKSLTKYLKSKTLKTNNGREVQNLNADKCVLNMKKKPGLCKHLMMSAMLLMDGSLIEPGKNYIRDFNLETLRRSVRRKLMNTNKDNSGVDISSKKYTSEIENAQKMGIQEDINKKTNFINKEVKDVTIAKKPIKRVGDGLIPKELENYINQYAFSKTIYEDLAWYELGEGALESDVAERAKKFMVQSYTDTKSFYSYLNEIIKRGKEQRDSMPLLEQVLQNPRNINNYKAQIMRFLNDYGNKKWS